MVTMIHESSHYGDIPREGKFKKIYSTFGTQDLYYVGSKNTRLAQDYEGYISDVIPQLTANNKVLSKFGATLRSGEKVSGVKAVLDNADTIALIALSLEGEAIKNYEAVIKNRKNGIC